MANNPEQELSKQSQSPILDRIKQWFTGPTVPDEQLSTIMKRPFSGDVDDAISYINKQLAKPGPEHPTAIQREDDAYFKAEYTKQLQALQALKNKPSKLPQEPTDLSFAGRVAPNTKTAQNGGNAISTTPKSPEQEIANAQIKQANTPGVSGKSPEQELSGLSPYQGGFRTFGDSQYLRNFTADADPNTIKAQNQHFWDEFSNALVQSGGGLALGVGEGAGYLGVGNIVDKIRGTEQEVGNSWSNYFSQLNEELKQEVVPVYTPESGQNWHEWFNSNLPSIAESISLLIPASGFTKTIGAVGKTVGGLKLAKRLGMTTQALEFGEAITSAAASRHMENSMEEIEAYQNLYDEAIQKGLPEGEAKEAAKQAANEVYWKNWPLVINDILQFSIANKSINAISRAKSMEAATKKLTSSTIFGNLLTSAGLEGGEEAYQFIVNEEAKRKSAIEHKVREDDFKTYSDRVMDYVSDPDFWTSAFFGALGGMLFEGVAAKRDKTQQERLQKVVSNYQKSIAEKIGAVYTEDPIKFAKSQDTDNMNIILSSVMNQQADQAEKLFNTVLNADFSNIPEEQKEEAEQAQQRAKQALEDLTAIENEYNNIRKDPTSINDSKEIVAARLANRFELRSNKRIFDQIGNIQTQQLDTITSERGLSSTESLLLEAITQKEVIENEYTKTNIADKDIIDKKLADLDQIIKLHLDSLITSSQQTAEEIYKKLGNINKSSLAQTISNRTPWEFRIAQNNKDYDKFTSSKGKKEVQKEIEEYKNKEAETNYKALVDSVTPNSSLDEFRAARDKAKELGKEGKFNMDTQAKLETIKKSSAPFIPSNPKISLDDRYKNNRLLQESEGNAIYNLMMKSGGVPENSTFNNDLIASEYNNNPQFAQRLNDFFKIKTETPKKENTTKQPVNDQPSVASEGEIRDKELKSQTPPIENAWVLQGDQYVFDKETKEYKRNEDGTLVAMGGNLSSKIDWSFLNKGGLEIGSTLHIEYDFEDNWNQNNKNSNLSLFELVYYSDGNTLNKQFINRHVVGALRSYQENKNFVNEQEKIDLKTIRESLFKQVMQSEFKTGRITLKETTKVAKVLGGNIYNTRYFSNPTQVIRPDQELVFAIGQSTSNGQVFYNTNGHPYQYKVNEYSTAEKGKVYMLLPDASGNIIPIKIFTKKVGDFPGFEAILADKFAELKSAKTSEEKKNIIDQISEDVYVQDANFVNNKYYITIGDIENPTVLELTEEQLEGAIKDLVVQVDINKINNGTYNQDISEEGRVVTDLNPSAHFHTARVVISNPLAQTTSTVIQTTTVTNPENPSETKQGSTRKKVKGVESANVKLGNGKASLVIPEQTIYNTIKEDSVRDWFKKNLSQVPVDVIPHLIEVSKNGGTKAWGMFKDASITLYNAAPAGTEYHEAFHAVFNLFLTDKQREEILNEQGAIQGALKGRKANFSNYRINNNKAINGSIETTEIYKQPRYTELPSINDYISEGFEMDVDINLLAPSQLHINTDYVSSGNDYLPRVNKIGNIYVIRDGHHRLAHQILQGATTARVTVRFTDINERNLALEEQLANQFADYVQQNQANESKLGYNTKNFFRKLWESIKAIFGIESKISIDSLFERINTGYYNDAKLKDLGYTSPRYSIKNKDPYSVKRNINFINYSFFNELNNLKEKLNITELTDIEALKTIDSNPDQAIYNLYSRVYNGILDEIDRLTEEDKIEAANELGEIVDNLIPTDEEGNTIGRGDYYMLAIRDLARYGIKVSTAGSLSIAYDSNLEEGAYELNEEEEKLSSWEVKAINTSGKDTIGYNVKKLLRRIIAYTQNENGEVVPDQDKFGFPRFISFDVIYNKLREELTEIYDSNQMMDVLRDLAKNKLEFYGIVEELDRNPSLKAQFFSDFATQSIEFYRVEQKITNDQDFGQRTTFRIYNANRISGAKLLTDKWYTNLITTGLNSVTDKEGRIDKEKATILLAEYDKFVANAKKAKAVTLEPNKALSNLLYKFGIEITPEALQGEYRERQFFEKGRVISVTAYENYISLLEGKESLRNILVPISLGVNPYQGEGAEFSSINSVTRRIATQESSLHEAVVRMSDKNYYSYNLPTFLSKKLSEYKSDQGLQNYLGNWWFKRNKWLQDLSTDRDFRNKFGFVVHGETQLAFSNSGTRYFDLSDKELDITDLNMYWNSKGAYGLYRTPILSDTGQAVYLRAKKYNKQEIIDALYQIALGEKDRIELIGNSDIEISGYSKNGGDYHFVPIFNEIDVNNESEAKKAIETWLEGELTIEKNRLMENTVLNAQGAFNSSLDSRVTNRADFLRDYFYNKVLANILTTQLTSVDLAAYKTYSDFQKRNGQIFKFVRTIDTNAIWTDGTAASRFYRTAYLKDNKINNKELSDFVEKMLVEKGYSPDYARTIAAAYDASTPARNNKAVNQTDAQAYITLDRYKKIMIGLGKWDNRYESAYQKAKKGIAWDKDYELFLQPIKPFLFQHELIQGTSFIIPAQNKNSEVVLIPALAKQSKQLKAVLDFMNTNKVDSIQFESAVKAGLYGEVTVEDFNKGKMPIIHTMDNQYWGIQQETPEHHIDEANLLGTQIKKIIFGDIPDTAKFFNGKYTKEQLFNIYQSLLTTNLQESYNTVASEFNDPKKIQKLILDQIVDRNLGQYFEEQFALMNDNKFKLPAYYPANSKLIENMLNSIIRKAVTKQKINGGSFVLMSNFGLSDKLKIVYDEKIGAIDYMEVMLPWWSKKYFPVNPDGNVDFERIKREAPELLDIIGYRIPTEHKYSIKKLRVVGFTPDIMGGVAILPAEITTIAGEDFDIDKLYTMIPNFEIKDGKIGKVKSSFESENSTKEQRDNAIIDIIGEIWSHPAVSDQIMIPGGFETLKKLANRVDSLTNESTNDNPMMPRTQMKYFNTNTVGATLIGIAANHNSNQTIMQYSNVAFSKDYEFNFDGKRETKLNKTKNFNGNYISRDVAEFLAAFVDTAKDPVSNRLNLNTYTFDVVATIVRLGYGLDTAMAFINQPILREYTKQYFRNGGNYTASVRTGNQLKQQLLKKIGKSVEPQIYGFETPVLWAQVSNMLPKDFSELDAEYQLRVLHTFENYKIAANSLSSAMTAMKSDTSGTGKTMADNSVTLNKILLSLGDSNITGLDGILTGDNYPLIAKANELLQRSQSELLGMYLPYGNSGYTYLYQEASLIKGRSLTADEINFINNQSLSFYVSSFDFFNSNEKEIFINKFPKRYVELVKELGLEQYELIKYLKYSPEDDSNPIPFVEFISSLGISKEQRENITRSWEAMFNSDDKRISKFAIDLLKYNFHTNNLSFKYKGLASFIPPSIFEAITNSEGVTFRDYLYKLQEDSATNGEIFDYFIDQFYRNYLDYPNLLRQYKLEDVTGNIQKNGRITSITFDEGKAKENDLLTAIGAISFIRLTTDNVDHVYKYAGKTQTGDLVYNIQEPLGTNFITEFDRNNPSLSSVLKINKYNLSEDSFYTTEQSGEQYYQLEREEGTEAPESINNRVNDKLKEILGTWGVKVEYVNDLYLRTGSKAVAEADLFHKIIKIAKGSENKNTLPEEFGHFVEAFNRGTDFHNTLMNLVPRTKLYKDIHDQYFDIYNNDEAKVRQEVIGQLLGQSFIREINNKEEFGITDQIKRLFQRLWDAVIKFFKNKDEIYLQSQIQAITKKITKDVLEGKEYNKAKIKLNGKFYQLSTQQEVRAEKILKEGIESIYKKIKIYEDTGTKQYKENRQNLLAKLKDEYNKKNYELGLVIYIENAKEELINVVNRFNSIENKTYDKVDDKKAILDTLRKMKKYSDGFKQTLSDIAKGNIINDAAVRANLAETNLIIEGLEGQYYRIGKGILTDVLKEFNANDKLNIDAALDILENDISFTRRWLDSLAESTDPILELVDSIVKDAKHRSRIETLDFTKELLKLQQKLTDAGIPNTSFMAERDFNGNITGRYVTEYNMGEYIKQRTKFWENLKIDFPEEPSEDDPRRKEYINRISKWYKENTQVRRDRDAFAQKKKVDFIQDYGETIGNTKYNEWLAANIRQYEGNPKVYYRGEFLIPSDKYLSTQYQEIQSSPSKKEYHNFVVNSIESQDEQLPEQYQLKGYLPQVKKDFYDRIIIITPEGEKKYKSIKEIGKEAKGSLADQFRIHENDTEFGITDENNTPVNFIPVYFTKKLADMNQLSLDITSNMSAYMYSANDFKEMNNIIGVLEYTKDVVGERKVLTGTKDLVTLLSDKITRTKNGRDVKYKDEFIQGKDSRAYERLEDYLNMIVYGRQNKQEKYAKLADFLNKFTSLNTLALNMYSGISNVLVGNAMIRMESLSGEYVSSKDYAWANTTYTTLLPDKLSNIGNSLSTSKLDLWVEYMDTLQNYEKDFRDLEADRSRIGRLFQTSSLFFINHAGEHMLQTRMSLALAHNTKVKDLMGNEFSLWDAFEVVDKKLKLKSGLKKIGSKNGLFKESEDGQDLTDRDIRRFINKQNFINKRLHGIYNNPDKSAVQQYALGRLAMMYRKFIKPGWNRRFEKLTYNQEGEVYTEGYYTSLWNFMKNMYKELREGQFSLSKNWNNLTPRERANFARLFTEWGYVIAAAVLFNVLSNLADDDDDNALLALSAYQAGRLYSELRFFTSLTEGLRIMKSPAPAVYQLQKLTRAIEIWNWTDEIEKGKYKGLTRGEVNLIELTPFVGTYYNFKTPEEQLKFYTNQGLGVI